MSLIPHIKNSEKEGGPNKHECPTKHENGMVWKSPSFAIFSGGTGSGKTNALLAAIGHQSKWRPFDGGIFLLSPNVEAAIKGEYGVLDHVIPLTEWPAIDYWDAYPGRKLLICDDNAVVGLSTRGGVDSQRNRADRTCGYTRTHKCLNIYMCQQMVVNVPPNLRRLASHFILFPNRISKDTIPFIAKNIMISRPHLEQIFQWCIDDGPYSFALITNEPDGSGRARVRINGDRPVNGIN
eukprot:COSAG05_NODE_931_length_6549_cov_15.020775_4_plen_238_part_00